MMRDLSYDQYAALTGVSLDSDGCYRWMYVMDMNKNRSIMFYLMKIFFWITAACYAVWLGLLFFNHRLERQTFIWATVIFALIMLAIWALVWIGYTISSHALEGEERICFEMDDARISMFQAGKNMERRKRGSTLRPMDTYSTAYFNYVRKVVVYRKWDMIDLHCIGSRFQLYAKDIYLDTVLDHIRACIPASVKIKEKS